MVLGGVQVCRPDNSSRLLLTVALRKCCLFMMDRVQYFQRIGARIGWEIVAPEKNMPAIQFPATEFTAESEEWRACLIEAHMKQSKVRCFLLCFCFLLTSDRSLRTGKP